jgi:hypothetical protein
MALSNEQLHTLAFAVTPEIMKPEHRHMAEIWKAFLGGFVLPEMANQEPASVAGNEAFEAMIKEYSKENIADMFAPKVEEKIIEVIKEVPTIVEKTVVVREGEHVVHRRLRKEVHKVSRKKRDMSLEERDLVIHVFNEKQDMLEKTSEVFKTLVDTINAHRLEDEQISASQLAGYWSSLCRWADREHSRREAWVLKSLKREIYSIRPIYTDGFVAKIKANYEAKRVEAEERRKDHAVIKETGERRKIIVSEMPKAEPVPLSELDLTDII